jgi:drug/metabolite transporter (DMT)-like permease
MADERIGQVSVPRPARRLEAWTVLLLVGILWGLSFSLTRIAARGGDHPFGIALWECAFSGVIISSLVAVRRLTVKLSWTAIRVHLVTGFTGMVVPSVVLFYAASHIPAGILSISVALVPVLTFVASLAAGVERPAWGRLLGVVLGLAAIVLLVGPKDSLPDPAQLPWVMLALLAPFGYAALSMVPILMGSPSDNPFVTTSGMFATATLMLLILTQATGTTMPLDWPLSAAAWAIVGLALINALNYVLFFRLIETAGPVFTSLIANFVTLFGVIWGIVIFGEVNSIWVWLSLVVMMAALLLVAPRGRAASDAGGGH